MSLQILRSRNFEKHTLPSDFSVPVANSVEFGFKDFLCPPEGGDIIGHTTDGSTVKGKIESNRKLVFTLEDANSNKFYFEGNLHKTNTFITGNYGAEENEYD